MVAGTGRIKIATWNVNGVRAREGELHAWIGSQKPDIICLQELKAAPPQLSMTLCEIDGYWCYWHGQKGYSGVGLHVSKTRWPEKPEFAHPPFDFESRIVCVRLGPLTVASVYVPNGGKDYLAKLKFVEALEGFASSFQAAGAPLLVCGDLNIAREDMDVHEKERKPNGIGQRPEERALFERLLAQGLTDVGRAADPMNAELFTWWPPWRSMRQRNIGWRIDYILASHDMMPRMKTCEVQSAIGTSDHAPVVAEFDPL
jgi:exodeoxyribonuclease-3